MRAPKKVIAAMAMATMIGGTVAPAFADDFKATGGAINGSPAQTTNTEMTLTKSDAQGKITVTGTFTRHISTLPDVDLTQNAKYIRVTMPLALNYTYDVGTHEMHSVPGKVINESVEVTGAVPATSSTQAVNGTEKKQAIEMTFVGMDAINQQNVKYVSEVRSDDNQNVQLPFQLVVTKNGQEATRINLEELVRAKSETSLQKQLKLEAGTSVDFTIDRIGSQQVKNGEKLENNAKVSSGITLKFAYPEK